MKAEYERQACAKRTETLPGRMRTCDHAAASCCIALRKTRGNDHQNFTWGGVAAPSFAVNSAIGFSPENAVFAQMTVGNVRSAVL